MSATDHAVLNRSDTLLGVCQAIGQDFGIDPLWPRLAFGALLFWNLGIAVGVYFALGMAVLASRLLFPARSAAPNADPVATLPAGDNDDLLPELARAA